MKTIIFAALVAALPALVAAPPARAHHDEPHPQQMAQGRPDPSVQEMQRERRNPTATPWVPGQNRDAGQADTAGIDDAAGLINAASTALRSNRRGQAIEFMERAESRLLTRSTPAPRAGDAVSVGPVARIAAARAAASAGDTRKAQDELTAALEALDRPRRRRGG